MKLLIVDDHVIVREGVRRLLAPFPDITIHEAASASSAVTAFRNHRPDIVLLDLNLPRSSGLELLRRLLSEEGSANVLVFSMHEEPLYVTRALNAGARGYISKGAASEELLTAIRRVAEGGRYVEREIAAQIVLMPNPGQDPLQRLTAREADILRMLAEGETPAAIAAACGVTYKTIANSCTIIKEKLGVSRTADLIRLAIEMRERS
ncbi:MAG TPA: response regulator transcription factor [Steroidobacteraceae bacterium]|jgi:DNA-binding NarL/FixJ family response regulator